MMKRQKRLSAALLALGICVSLITPVPARAAEATENTGISTNSIPGWPQAQDIKMCIRDSLLIKPLNTVRNMIFISNPMLQFSI